MIGAEPGPNTEPAPSKFGVGKLAGFGLLLGGLYMWWKKKADPRVERHYHEHANPYSPPNPYDQDW